MSRLGAIVFALCLYATVSSAEEGKAPRIAKGTGVTVTLKGNKQVKGVYLGRHDGAVWVGLDGGEVGLEKETVLKIEPSETDDSEFLKRRAALASDDAKGHWELVKWADKAGLDSLAKGEAETVVRIDPEHLKARQFLGHEKINGAWLEHDDAMRAKGLVEYRGEWITQDEYAAIEKTRIEQEEATRRAQYSAAKRAVKSYRYYDRQVTTGYTESYRSSPKGSVR